MTPPRLDYRSRTAHRTPVGVDWRRRRFGMASLAIAGSVVIAVVLCLGATMVFDLRSSVMRGVLVGCAVGLLVGMMAGAIGTDSDRERRPAYFGLFLNLALLVPVGLVWILTMLVMDGF